MDPHHLCDHPHLLPGPQPALGFTRDGRPVGLQMVGRPRGEAELLGTAAALEEILDIARLVPLDPRPPS